MDTLLSLHQQTEYYILPQRINLILLSGPLSCWLPYKSQINTTGRPCHPATKLDLMIAEVSPLKKENGNGFETNKSLLLLSLLNRNYTLHFIIPPPPANKVGGVSLCLSLCLCRIVSGPKLFFGLTLVYQIWHMGVSPWDDWHTIFGTWVYNHERMYHSHLWSRFNIDLWP